MSEMPAAPTTRTTGTPSPPVGQMLSTAATDANHMERRQDLMERLAASVPGGYFPRGEPASEPTALAGLALSAGGDSAAARRAADWLVEQQAENGAVGVTATQKTPCWPTSLAILLWQAIGDNERYGQPASRAVEWALTDHGETGRQEPYVGHNTTLVGWSWAAHTHSWLEPTAMFVMALKAAGESQHPRTREGVRLLVDRLLPHGGCNYGNTIVLGQELLPHVQPTGIVMMALAGESNPDPRIERSLQYLERVLSADTTTASLCYGLLGLAAHNRQSENQRGWLESVYQRTIRQPPSPYKLALIALASTDQYLFPT
jgi:hypothetical protein